ncbi:uncharacterized protein LOC126263572 [Schistocerca nitens]|uniref:uncharacterized protein LOC126263572 n=1 Tax=Schistocerca nitens TaxID=7011 RepID=UPI0021190BA2|nr:uncharacterized protein LOC126263572 [Schistocerca nitens]
MWRLQRHPLQVCVWRWAATTAACLLVALPVEEAEARATKRSVTDTSVMGYLTERTCWWNEICKEEFQTLFRCKCPVWSFCRSPGRYYNAFCTMTGTGYIWTQPEPSWGRRQSAPAADFDAAGGGDPQQRARAGAGLEPTAGGARTHQPDLPYAAVVEERPNPQPPAGGSRLLASARV